MKLAKPVFYVASALLLTSCGSLSKIASLPLESAHEITADIPKTNAIDKETLKQWPHQNLASTGFPGLSLDKAYQVLQGRKSKSIIVGVIDSGVDINHEDLKSVIWVNEKEIPNNGKDDDNNGFIDDIHGWNFLGNITKENMEYVRVLLHGDKNSEQYKKAEAEYQAEYRQAKHMFSNFDRIYHLIKKNDKIIRKYVTLDDYSAEDLDKIPTEKINQNSDLAHAISFMKSTILGPSKNKINHMKEQIKEAYDYYKSKVEGHLNKNLNARKILGDDPYNITDNRYGDANVIGPVLDEALHGTHVAGIIGAVRKNGLGGDGVADNVRIMAIRAVPDGDEYDKDIALAIRYAVDNGAKVINTSFGKAYSQNPEWVREAIKYAAEKDVLIVNAAGNDAKDIDTNITFPDDNIDTQEYTNNVLTIGALNYQYNENLLAVFSNYGQKNVDIFAPGVEIYATIPGNKYKFLQGTSMASPEVAGLAALIRSYFPKLTANQVKQIIMDSGITPEIKQVNIGDGHLKKSFSEVCKSGKIANAYNAIILAAKMSK